SKATGQPLAKIAARCMVGQSLATQPRNQGRRPGEVIPPYFSVKEAVFPFNKFPGVDPILGPEMRSTGEVMGIDVDFQAAFAKAQIAAGDTLPTTGVVFISVKDSDKPMMVEAARDLVAMGFSIVASEGTAKLLAEAGVAVTRINKVAEGRPHIVDSMKNGEIQLVFNTTEGAQSYRDSFSIRRTALQQDIPYYTTIAGAKATIQAIKRLRTGDLEVRPLQAYA
ncbi:MAG: carbamoyl phosphate synthase large subunit, partial [Hyphomicrobium sp.]